MLGQVRSAKAIASLMRPLAISAPVAVPSASFSAAGATQMYDKVIASKFPRIVDVVNRKLTVDDLSYTERVAYSVALHNQGGNRGRTARRTERNREFQARVETRMREFHNALTRRKATMERMKVVAIAEKKVKQSLRRERYTLDRSVIFGGVPLVKAAAPEAK